MDKAEHINFDVFTTANSMHIAYNVGACIPFKEASSESSLQGPSRGIPPVKNRFVMHLVLSNLTKSQRFK
jgi:hypothetical protein